MIDEEIAKKHAILVDLFNLKKLKMINQDRMIFGDFS